MTIADGMAHRAVSLLSRIDRIKQMAHDAKNAPAIVQDMPLVENVRNSPDIMYIRIIRDADISLLLKGCDI